MVLAPLEESQEEEKEEHLTEEDGVCPTINMDLTMSNQSEGPDIIETSILTGQDEIQSSQKHLVVLDEEEEILP